MLVDLHIHSYYSDGTMSPQEIVEEAIRKNVRCYLQSQIMMFWIHYEELKMKQIRKD